MNKVVNPDVMTVLFVSAVLPVGFMLRLSGKDTLRLKLRPDAASYRIERAGRERAADEMKKQF